MRTAVLAERSLMGAVATLARRILEADFARLGGIQVGTRLYQMAEGGIGWRRCSPCPPLWH